MNKDDILANEDELLQGMLEAAEDKENEFALIEIARKEKVLFAFRVRPLSEKENERCKELATKYTRKRGIRIADSHDTAKYRSYLIHTATLEEDRVKTWDNKALWDKLNVLSAVDAIEKVLLPGEKDAVINKITELSGYTDDDDEDEIDDLEDLAKN